jgi:ribosome maturation factor RimP
MQEALDRLTDEIRAHLAELGFELVDLRRGGTKRRAHLQVRVDRPDAAPGQGITIEECAAVSRALERWLDQTGTLGSGYVLEVSSPGVERPVRWREHWIRFVGQDVRVKLPDRGRVRATIVGVDVEADTVELRLSLSDQTLTVPITEAREARLVADWDQ